MAYPSRVSRSEGAGESRRPPPGNDRRRGGAVPQNAGERRNPAAVGRCDRRGGEDYLQIFAGTIRR